MRLRKVAGVSAGTGTWQRCFTRKVATDEAREHAVKALEMDPNIWNGEKLLLALQRLEAEKGY